MREALTPAIADQLLREVRSAWILKLARSSVKQESQLQSLLDLTMPLYFLRSTKNVMLLVVHMKKILLKVSHMKRNISS